MTRQVKLAAAHVAPVFMDAMASAEKAVEWIKKAGREEVNLVVFPEDLECTWQVTEPVKKYYNFG